MRFRLPAAEPEAGRTIKREVSQYLEMIDFGKIAALYATVVVAHVLAAQRLSCDGGCASAGFAGYPLPTAPPQGGREMIAAAAPQSDSGWSVWHSVCR